MYRLRKCPEQGHVLFYVYAGAASTRRHRRNILFEILSGFWILSFGLVELCYSHQASGYTKQACGFQARGLQV